MSDTEQGSVDVARSVYDKVEQLLREHGCIIQTVLAAEPVGQDASRALISSRWGVVKVQEGSDADATPTD